MPVLLPQQLVNVVHRRHLQMGKPVAILNHTAKFHTSFSEWCAVEQGLSKRTLHVCVRLQMAGAFTSSRALVHVRNVHRCWTSRCAWCLLCACKRTFCSPTASQVHREDVRASECGRRHTAPEPCAHLFAARTHTLTQSVQSRALPAIRASETRPVPPKR